MDTGDDIEEAALFEDVGKLAERVAVDDASPVVLGLFRVQELGCRVYGLGLFQDVGKLAERVAVDDVFPAVLGLFRSQVWAQGLGLRA